MKDDGTISGMETMSGGWAERGGEWNDTLSGQATEGGDGRVVLAGRYRVVRRLGEGGMGSVWLAEDGKLDGRKVAIKMLPAVLAAKKGAYRQVKQEALLAMKLSHPNIATVRAFEEDEGGSPFLVMDYIEGEGLDDILAERGPLGEEETVRLLGPVAAALDYAHGKGVVHRDVKPGNVIVAKDGTPYVLDFGIAREIQETMTRVTGKLSSGTLLYMSPEQLHGRAPKAAQDVYSFAAMAYECLTGNPPFARGQIEYQIDHDAPEPLEEGVAGAALRAGVMAGLAKEPGGRPGSCAGVLGSPDGKQGAGPGNPPAARPVQNPPAAAADDEDLFLLKVRTERMLAEAEGKPVYEVEKAELERVRELHAAGEAALKAGAHATAAGLFRQCGEAFEAWRERVAQRQAQERSGRAAAAQRIARGTKKQAHPFFIAGDKAGAEKTLSLGNGRRMTFVWCPAGRFMMGSPPEENGRWNDEGLHSVTLTSGFWLAKHQLTQEQWQSVMGFNPSEFQGTNLPVECVSWNDAKEFCLKTGMRLPTEAEWEYACRAGSTGKFAGTGLLDSMGWYWENSGRHPHPVGQKQPNAWGLHDMHGNVWEWCEDPYAADLGTQAVTDPTGGGTGAHHVVRGGSWHYGAWYCRSAYRSRCVPTFRRNDFGFRPVCVLEGP